MKEDIFKINFINCLKRCVKGFLIEMENNSLEVGSIRLGEGHNDVEELLVSFEKLYNQPILSGYCGYSDAENQYVLYSKK